MSTIKVEVPCSYVEDALTSSGRVIADITSVDYQEVLIKVNGYTYKFDADDLARALIAVVR